jgi:CHAT domain-containing protein/Flp pilus assembly protein TadD
MVLFQKYQKKSRLQQKSKHLCLVIMLIGSNSIVETSLASQVMQISQQVPSNVTLSAAEAVFKEALQLYRQGTVESIRRSIPKLQEAYRRFESIGNHFQAARALNRIGQIYAGLGEKDKALEFLNQALDMRRAINDRIGEVYTLTNLGNVYIVLGQKDKALEYFQQSLLLSRASANQDGETISLNNLGQLSDILGEKRKVLEYFSQALVLSRTVHNRVQEARSLSGLGKIYAELGENQKALEYYDLSLSIRQVAGDASAEAVTLDGLGKIYDRLGQKEKALKYFNQSILINQAVGRRGRKARTLVNIAKVLRDQGKLKLALQHIQAATEIFDDLRSDIDNPDLRMSYFTTVQYYYQLQIDILMQLHQQSPTPGYDRIALETSERARARSMLDLLNESSIDPKPTQKNTPLFTQERQLQQSLQQIEKQRLTLLNGKHTPAQTEDLTKRSDDLIQKLKDIAARLRVQDPAYADIKYPQPLTLAQIQQQVLDENTVLLEYSLGTKHSYLWMVTKTTFSSYVLPKGSDVEAAVNSFRKVLTDSSQGNNPTEGAQASAPLSQMLLKPVASQLGNKRLLIVSDGILHYLPFAALSLPFQNQDADLQQMMPSILIKHEIVNMPSASTLAVLRNEQTKRRPASRSIAIFADPVFSKDDIRLQKKNSESALQKDKFLKNLAKDTSRNAVLGRLSYTRQEAEQIIKLFPDKRSEYLALDFDANKENAIRSGLNQYRIVHFATHGILDSSHPEQSGIALSNIDKQGTYQDGTLKLIDIFNLNLSADLVVLSACQTALGKAKRGEGLVGLTRGFMYAGTARILASLWDVNDESTASFMTLFYKAVLERGLPPAAALRVAQLELQKQEKWRSPYYWAAFTLQGEWK